MDGILNGWVGGWMDGINGWQRQSYRNVERKKYITVKYLGSGATLISNFSSSTYLVKLLNHSVLFPHLYTGTSNDLL